MTPLKRVFVTTDGACIRNPGQGGWACVLRFEDRVVEIFGCDPNTTNNRMELQAVIEGLRALHEPCAVIVYTDSQYVQRGITEWLPGWKARGWRKAGKGGAVLNQQLWKELDNLVQLNNVKWEWIKGHADNRDNLRSDFLANRAAREQISSSAR